MALFWVSGSDIETARFHHALAVRRLLGHLRRGRNRPSASRIGVLSGLAESDPSVQPKVAAFEGALASWVGHDGRNVMIAMLGR